MGQSQSNPHLQSAQSRQIGTGQTELVPGGGGKLQISSGWDRRREGLGRGWFCARPANQGATHPAAKGKHPDGGNVLFTDGSARWIKFANMYFITSFEADARIFAYQEDWGNITPAQLNLMKPQATDFD
jgi:prepilin-type processing-associated H-X9-DG protein